MKTEQTSRIPGFSVDITQKKTSAGLTFEIPPTLRPKGIQYLDWRLLQYMYDRYFRYGRSCYVRASKLAHILSPGKGSAPSIRNSRCRLKKAGLINVENARSDFSNGMIAFCFMTEKGKNLMTEFFKSKPSKQSHKSKDNPDEDPVNTENQGFQRDLSNKSNKSQTKYSPFDYRVSRRFSKNIQKAYPMKAKITWNESWAEEIRKIRVVDGFSEKEIEDTIKFILNDNVPHGDRGFCFAKVLRSCLNFRHKWKNGLTKFASAFEDMRAEKLAHPDEDDEDTLPDALRKVPLVGDVFEVKDEETESKFYTRKILTPPRDFPDNSGRFPKTSETYQRLLDLPRPKWKLNSKSFLEYEQFCFDLALLFEEFILDRHWNPKTVDLFFEVLKVDCKELKFYTTDILRERVQIFFFERVQVHFPHIVGYFNIWSKYQGKKWGRNAKDDTYRQRLEDFLADQKELEPFRNSTSIIPDSEVEWDDMWHKCEKGEFQQVF